VFPCLSCRRLDADVRCDASQNDCLDTAAAQLQIQLRAVEGAPLALVMRMSPGFANPSINSLKFSGKPPGGMANADRRAVSSVFEILGETYIH